MKQKKLIFNFFVNRNWKKLTDSRKRAQILADNRKSHHPIETLVLGFNVKASNSVTRGYFHSRASLLSPSWRATHNKTKNNNVFCSRSIKLTVLNQCPANSYSANLGRTKIIVKALLNYILRKKEKKRHTTMIHRKKNPSHKLKHKGFVIIKKK